MNENSLNLIFIIRNHKFFNIMEIHVKDSEEEQFINSRDQFGRTPLFYAVKSRSIEIVKLLLENKANVEITAEKSKSILHFLLEEAEDEDKVEDIFHLLLSKNTPVCVIDSDGKTLLHYAAKNKQKKILMVLIPKMAKFLTTVDCYKKTALHFLLESIKDTDDENFVEVVELMLKTNPAIAIMHDKYGHTFLHLAAKNKLIKIAKILIPYFKEGKKP